MFTQTPIEATLEAEILSVLKELDLHETTSEKYATLIERLSKLQKLKVEERPKRISPDNALIVAANLLGIWWMTRYERENVISSKALGFVIRPNR